MADITGNTGEGIDIRNLASGTDVIGVFPSGTFHNTLDNFSDLGSSRIITAGSVNVNNFSDLGSQRTISAGSMIITNSPTVYQSRGAFGYSGANFHTSGTATNIITPGTGSKFLLKGFNASAVTASKFRILFSGGTVVNTFSLPASGTIAMNFLGMEPSGATNQPVAIGLYTGSVDISVFVTNTL